jgi:hypothetical protein
MTISLYAASIPVFRQFLNSMDSVLAKAEAHAAGKSIDHDAFMQARLFPDMLALVRQVQIAVDFSKGVSARLAGIDVPVFDDKEKTFPELRALLAKTIVFIDGIKPAQIDGNEEREIVLRPGTPKEKRLNGQAYLLSYGLPQFFFHITTAYGILRHNGVELGKSEYLMGSRA